MRAVEAATSSHSQNKMECVWSGAMMVSHAQSIVIGVKEPVPIPGGCIGDNKQRAGCVYMLSGIARMSAAHHQHTHSH